MEKNKIETGLSSDAKKEPRRVDFVTKKTSAKVVGERGPQLMTFPHLLIREAIAFQVLVIAMVIVALVWDAPLERLANPLLTPNPAKAPWYFLGLQELLHFFPPFVAGILIPTLVVVALIFIPHFNVNIEGRALWAYHPAQHLRTILIVALMLLALLATIKMVRRCCAGWYAILIVALMLLALLAGFHAWTIFVPTALLATLLVISYTG